MNSDYHYIFYDFEVKILIRTSTFGGVTLKVLSNSKHTLLCLYGHNILERIKPNTIENTAVVRSSGWRRKASKERLVFRYVQRMNKNVFLHVIRFICHTINM